jgi:hypothetical protein
MYPPTTWLTLYSLKTQLTGGNQGKHVALHMQRPYIFQNKNGFPTIQDKSHGLAWLGLGGLGLGGLGLGGLGLGGLGLRVPACVGLAWVCKYFMRTLTSY